MAMRHDSRIIDYLKIPPYNVGRINTTDVLVPRAVLELGNRLQINHMHTSHWAGTVYLQY